MGWFGDSNIFLGGIHLKIKKNNGTLRNFGTGVGQFCKTEVDFGKFFLKKSSPVGILVFCSILSISLYFLPQSLPLSILSSLCACMSTFCIYPCIWECVSVFAILMMRISIHGCFLCPYNPSKIEILFCEYVWELCINGV